MILVDTCSLLDILQASAYRVTTAALLTRLSGKHQLAINEVILAELSASIRKRDELAGFLKGTGLQLVRCPETALIHAGEMWRAYLAGGGRRQQRILPDFIIAAHALAGGLVTRDAYFRTVPGLTVYCPPDAGPV